MASPDAPKIAIIGAGIGGLAESSFVGLDDWHFGGRGHIFHRYDGVASLRDTVIECAGHRRTGLQSLQHWLVESVCAQLGCFNNPRVSVVHSMDPFGGVAQ